MVFFASTPFPNWYMKPTGGYWPPPGAYTCATGWLLYLLGYYLKPQEHNWNVGINVTNIDYYLLNQSTNPLFYLQGEYRPTERMSLFAEAWYKSAGAFNISVNYFGYLFRSGLLWKLP